jgi:hypothetical protein
VTDCIASEKTRGKPTGYQYWKCRCWKCSTASSVERAFYHDKDPEVRRETLRRWREKNPEKNRENNRKEARKYRDKNVAYLREKCRKWREENPDYWADPLRMSRANRLARQRSVERQLAQLGVEGYT